MKITSYLSSIVFMGLSIQGLAAEPYASELGTGLVITVNSLKRSGTDSVVLKGSIENTSTEEHSFSNCNSGPASGYVFRVDIQDPNGKKQYQQIKVGAEYVGSKHTALANLRPHQREQIWARITAPPADVEKVTLVFGCAAPPIEEIPLQK